MGAAGLGTKTKQPSSVVKMGFGLGLSLAISYTFVGKAQIQHNVFQSKTPLMLKLSQTKKLKKKILWWPVGQQAILYDKKVLSQQPSFNCHSPTTTTTPTTKQP